MSQAHLHSRLYGFYLDRYGLIRSGNYTLDSNKTAAIEGNTLQKKNVTQKDSTTTAQQQIQLPWLKFITLFWNRRVLWVAIKFGLAALVMNRYERLGFAILVICLAI